MKHKCLAGIVVFFAFFSIVITLLIAQIKLTLQPNFIISALDKSGIYSRLSDYADKLQLEEGQDIAQLVSIKSYIKAIDPLWLKNTINTNLPIVYDYISGKTNQFSVIIDLKSLKNNLPNSFVKESKLTIEGLKPCPENYTPPPDQFPDCLPKGVTPDTVNSLISTNDYDEIVFGIPDSYTLDSENKQIQDFRISYASLNKIFLITLIISIVLLIFIILLGLSYPPSIPRWLGITLAIPSGLLLAFDLFIKISQSILLSLLGNNQTSALVKSLSPLTSVFNQFILNPGILISAVIFIAGVVLIILSYIIPHPPETKPAPKPIPPAVPNNK